MSSLGSQSFTNNLKTITITDTVNSTGLVNQVLTSQSGGLQWLYASVLPTIGTGTLNAPVASTGGINSVAYVPGFDRYVLFVLAPLSTTPLNQIFLLTGVPTGRLGTHTPQSSCTWMLSGPTPAITVNPVYSAEMININDTNTAGASTLSLFAESNLPPTYSSGTALFKMVINLTVD